MREATTELKNWIYGLVTGEFGNEQIVQGFIRHYVLNGLSVDHVQQDILYHTKYSADECKDAVQSLRVALAWYAEREESRTLTEIQTIVDCVRKGISVRVEYFNPNEYDPECEDFVARACW